MLKIITITKYNWSVYFDSSVKSFYFNMLIILTEIEYRFLFCLHLYIVIRDLYGKFWDT